MADQGRAKAGFADVLNDFSTDDWTPKEKLEKPRPSRAETRETAEAVGFQSREPVKAAEPAPAKPKNTRRTTGRNDQFNVRTTTETKRRFKSLADAMGWSEAFAFRKPSSQWRKLSSSVNQK